MVSLWALIIFGNAAIGTFAQVVLKGDDILLSCTVSQSIYPQWTGPNPNGNITIYNYLGDPAINNLLGEKSSRLTWNPQNNKSLIMRKVVQYDSGVYTCINGSNDVEIYTVSVIVLPQKPVISNQETLADTRIVVRGTEDQPVELTCTSTGGYPKPNLKWYRGNNQTTSLIYNETSTMNDDGTYSVVQKYKFTPSRQEDRVSYLCQSSFNLAQPSYQSDQVLLYLNLKPSDPSVTSNTVTEDVFSKVANCTTSQFRPRPIQVRLQKEGNNVLTEITYAENDATETYTLTASYSDSLSRESNGNTLVCHIAHDAVPVELTGSGTIHVNFRPLTANLTGDTSTIVADATNTISLTCTSGTSNPKSVIKWFRNNQEETTTAAVQEADGDYNGKVTSQTLKFVPHRSMDGQKLYCTVHNNIDGQTPHESPRKTIDLLYHPLVYLPGGGEVTEGQDKTLQCDANAKPNPLFTWFHNDIDITSNSVVNGKRSELILHKVNRTNAGQYKCVAKNGYKPDGVNLTDVSVKFRPLTVHLTGATSNITADDVNKISLNCTSGTSNPQSIIKWFRNDQEVESTAVVQKSDGEYNGKVTSQILDFVPDRSMDGQDLYCTVHNSIDDHNPILSESKTMDLLYHPIIISLSAVKNVVEGNQTTFRCNVHSKPSANVTWYHGTDVVLTDRPTVNNIGQFVIPIVNRTHTGTYKCVANNGYVPNSANETDLVVQYTPDVEVTTRNVTVNDSTATLLCTASGVPTVYTYSEWQHTWLGYISKIHTMKLGNKPTLNLTSLTYEYSGIYQCTVSNGVFGSLNPNAGYGRAYLKVETYPIITTSSPKKVPAQLNISTSTTIHFYSNRDDNKVECYRLGSKHSCSYSIQKGTINLPVFDSIIQTEGLSANITFVIQHMDHFGAVTIIISNGIGQTPIDITVVPEGPPEIPHSIEIGDVSSTSVTISWIPGFNGGFDQTFLIQYSKYADKWDQYNHETINGVKNEGVLNTTITGLQRGTRHYFRLLAYNIKGNSSYTDIYNFSTTIQVSGTKNTSSDIMAIVAGGAATGVLVLIACTVVLVLVVRYRRKKGVRKEQTRRSLYGDETIYDEDGMEINQAYESGESLGIQPSSTTDGASKIYAQVDKCKKQTMQGDDNTYAVVDKTKKKDDNLLGQTDIYATPMKKKDKKQTKNNYQKKKGKKDKKDKGNKISGDDVYENAQELDLYRNIEQNDEKTDANLYHNGDENIPYKRNLNKDGLLYADLAFDNNNKGQKKLVIRGLENATDYVEVDFSKKAEPLPESDEEACNSQNNV